MAKPDIFDEIITYLKNNSQTDSGRTTISPEICQHFFTDTPKTPVEQPANQPVPSRRTGAPRRQSSAQMLAATVTETPQRKKAAPLPDLNQYDLASLNLLANSCKSCPLCEHRTNAVFGDGSPNADLMFIGDAPGYHEDMQGIPFVGEAGKLLTKMITAMQYTRTDVYITDTVKCRPPNNRKPLKDEAMCCLPYLNRQIEIIKPKVIVVLGPLPLKVLLNLTGIKTNRGQWLSYQNIPVMATFHPTYLLRYQEEKRDAWHDLQMVMKLLGERS
jgi:uracil-DNA glycosylase